MVWREYARFLRLLLSETAEVCGVGKHIYKQITLNCSLFDLVKWSVESTTSVHILTPGSCFLDIHAPLLISSDVLALGRSKARHPHHSHHSIFVLVDNIHFFSLFLLIVKGLLVFQLAAT